MFIILQLFVRAPEAYCAGLASVRECDTSKQHSFLSDPLLMWTAISITCMALIDMHDNVIVIVVVGMSMYLSGFVLALQYVVLLIVTQHVSGCVRVLCVRRL